MVSLSTLYVLLKVARNCIIAFLYYPSMTNRVVYHSAGSSLVSGQSSQTHTESDHDSVCSDGSWVITPAPTFQGPKSGQSVGEAFHPLEDLLIEHPTMSVYHHVISGNVDREEENDHEENDHEENENERALLQEDDPQSSINHNRELVLLQNRQRQQLAIHMQVPLTAKQYPSHKALPKPPKMSRKALRRHNTNNLRSNKSRTVRVQKCCFKAGRRRC